MLIYLIADFNLNPQVWCKLAYWEMAQRVGPLIGVHIPAVNILGDVPYGDGFSLDTLAQHTANPPESVRHTRCKIGLGKYSMMFYYYCVVIFLFFF